MKNILVGIPLKNHVNLALDEVKGFEELGYTCKTIVYNRNNPSISIFLKFYGVIINSLKILALLYKYKFDMLYLNSRFGPAGCVRDFLTILIVKTFYFDTLDITIKTHGSDLAFAQKKSFFFDRIIFSFLGKKVDFWFFLSEEEKNTIQICQPIIGEKSYVTQNIIDSKRSVQSEEFLLKYNLNDQRFKFFFAGRMIAEKGIFNIIRAITNFKYKEDCVFIFAGDGKDFKDFKDEIKTLGVDNYVFLTGFLPEEECDHFYANVDALIFPTYFDEGFPMTLFKSVSCGLPVITTQTRAAIDYLKYPDNCLWVDGRSPKSITKALTQLFENKELRENMKYQNFMLGHVFSKQKVMSKVHRVFVEN